ncbi:retrotransposon protein, putative, ty1-copia subclass [Tanacetum coccineum]
MVRLMMNLTTLPFSFWDYALESAARLLNMVPTKKVDKTPYELWYGIVPNLSYLKETIGYYFYFPPENKIVVARYAEFFEKNLISQKASKRAVELEEIQEEDTPPSKNTSEHLVEEESLKPQEDVALVWDLTEPTNYKAALSNPESAKWLDAINREMQYMKDNQVWRFIDLPHNAKTVRSKWLFKKKTDIDDRSKRLIGLSQSVYMDKILKRFRMDDSKRDNIPMQERLDLNKTQGASTPEEVKRMQNVPYASINGGTVEWKSSKQSTTAMSATEAEYIASSEAAIEAVWIRKFITGLGIKGTRHYHRRYHYVHECTELGEIDLLKVHTDNNLADPFTKALPKGKLTQHARSIGRRLASSFM